MKVMLTLDWQLAHSIWRKPHWPKLHVVLALLHGTLSLDLPNVALAFLAGLLALPGATNGDAVLSARLQARGDILAALLATLKRRKRSALTP